ncbi:MAG: tetratricopeptide repeat protein, partial [Blastocatellia bacterium]
DSFVEETNLAQNISTVRKALGERPEGTQYVETVPKRGYRFIEPVKTFVEEGAESPLTHRPLTHSGQNPYPRFSETEVQLPARHAPATVPRDDIDESGPDTSGGFPDLTIDRQQSVESRILRSPWLKVAIAVVALSAIAVGLVYLGRVRQRTALQGTRAAFTLAVLPFQNLKPDPQTDFLGFSLADAIITRLDYVGSLIVRPSSYVGKYQNKPIDPRGVATDLNVNTLLTGTYVKDGDDLRISAQLIDVTANRILWRDTIDLRYEKLLTVQDQVVQQIIKGLELNLSPAEAERFQRDVPADPAAYEYYLRGIDLAQAGKFGAAIEALQKSISTDPKYSLTWAQLGAAYTSRAAFGFGGRDDYGHAQDAYEQALKLDPDQIESRIFLSNFYTDTNRVEQAVPLLRQVIKTNPNNALAHWELSYAYRFAGFLPESAQEAEVARQLDPEVKINSSAMNAYLYMSQYDRFLKSLPDFEDSSFVTFYRGYVNYYLKDFAHASSNFDRAYALDPSLFPQIGKSLSFGIAGQHQDAKDLLQDIEKKVQENGVSDPEALYKIAQAYIALGEKPSGIRMLRRSIEDGFFCYPYLTTDPLLDPVRSDPEFAALIEEARNRHEEFKKKFFP